MKKHFLSIELLTIVSLCLLLFKPGFSEQQNSSQSAILKAFLNTNGIWEGYFCNYVNRSGGITQKGKILVEINVDKNGIVNMKNQFVDESNKKSDYAGYLSMKIVNNRLEYVGDTSIDENTGNRIENHAFNGYILDKHIYILEEYFEVLLDGTKEKRRNSIHYCLVDANEILQTADVFLNDKLLVFAHTVLKRKK